jgi:hypothetical protein
LTQKTSYPSGGVYAEALQNTALCFKDRDLKGGRVQLTGMGTPRAISGNFASVFSILGTDGKRYAVKCFTRSVEDQQARYGAVSSQLSRLDKSWQINFDYQSAGILVQGKWLPILKMEWVEANSLLSWLEANLHDPKAIAGVAADFAAVVSDLQDAGLAHGDLQHGNLLVDGSGRLRLIDYDGMYLPSLAGNGAAEKGHLNYQSPARTMQHYDETIDRFGAWLIYISLLLLLQEPGLWAQFHADGDEKLLFGQSDFEDPDSTLDALAEIPEMDVALDYLNACWVAADLAEVPDFEPAVLPSPAELLAASPYYVAATAPGRSGANGRSASYSSYRPIPAPVPSPAPPRVSTGLVLGLLALVGIPLLVVLAFVDVRLLAAAVPVLLGVGLVAWRWQPTLQSTSGGSTPSLGSLRSAREQAQDRVAAVTRALEDSAEQERRELLAASALQEAVADRERAELTRMRGTLVEEHKEVAEALHLLVQQEATRMREAMAQVRRDRLAAALQRYVLGNEPRTGLSRPMCERLVLRGIVTAADIRAVQVFWSIAHTEWITVIVKQSEQRVRVEGAGLARGNTFKAWYDALAKKAKAALPRKLPAAEAAALRAVCAEDRERLTVLQDRLAQRLAEQTAIVRRNHAGEHLKFRQQQASIRKAAALRRRQLQPELAAAQREFEDAQWAEEVAAGRRS